MSEVVIVPYPALSIRRSLDQTTWQQLEETWIQAIDILGRDPNGKAKLKEFCESYIREREEECYNGISGTDESRVLRSLVFELVVNKGALGNQSSPEILWAFVVVYGATNVHKTLEFLVNESSSSPLLAKLARIALHYLRTRLSTAVIRATAVLLVDNRLANAIRTPQWEDSVRALNNSEVTRLLNTNFATNTGVISGNITTDETNALLDMFPQLTPERASQILLQHNSSVEQATSYLLENPQALDMAAASLPVESTQKQRYKSVSRTKNANIDGPTHDSVTATLRLVYEADEDERDDTYDDALQASDEPASSAALMKTERYLWELYSKNSELFKRDSRKNKTRGEMKRVTEWTDEQIEGWARILDRNPRRRQFLEDRYMFQGNLPHLRNKIWQQDVAETSEPESVVSSGPSSAAVSRSTSPNPRKIMSQRSATPNTAIEESSNNKQQSSGPQPKSKPNSYRKRNSERQFRKNKATKKQGLESGV